MKRMTILTLVFAMLISLLAACGTKTPYESGDVPDIPLPPDDGYTLPLGDGTQALHILTPESLHPTVKNYADMPVFKKYADEMGIKLDWEVVPLTDYDTVVNLRLTTNTDLADIIRLPFDSSMFWGSFVEAELFSDLAPLLRFAPNIVRMYWDYRPDIRRAVTWTDGKLYLLPSVVMGIVEGKNANDAANPNGFVMRGDIMQKYEMNEPSTVEDFHTILATIKENETGMIPFSVDAFDTLIRAFGLLWGLNTFDDLQVNEDGKVSYVYTDPRMRDVFQTLADWYAEGLIDKEPVGGAEGTWGRKAVDGRLFSTYGSAGYCFVIQPELAKNIPGAGFRLIPYPSADGNMPFIPSSPTWDNTWGIWEGSKNKELAIKAMDYMFFRDESFIDQIYGLEGTDYVMVDGFPAATEYAITEMAKDGNYAYSTGAYVHNRLTMVYVEEYRVASYRDFLSGHPFESEIIRVSQLIGSSTNTLFPKMLFTVDEAQLTRQYMADIDLYVKQTIAAMIRGEMPVTRFDNFVTTLNGMGLEEAMELRQNQYDRYKNS